MKLNMYRILRSCVNIRDLGELIHVKKFRTYLVGLSFYKKCSLSAEVNEAVVSCQGRTTTAASIVCSAEQEIVTAHLAEELEPGHATVTYQFTGILNDKMHGFYRSKYTVNGEDR
jgi:hypothetical protein